MQSERARDHIQTLGISRNEQVPLTATGNLLPDMLSLAVRVDDKKLTTEWLAWGLTRDNKIGRLKPISICVETAPFKSLFRDVWKLRHCVVPADGWYEWRSHGSVETRQPFYFSRKDGAPFFFAGLWTQNTFALLTTASTGNLATIHERQPLALDVTQANRWLFSIPSLYEIMSAVIPSDEMDFHSASGWMHSPGSEMSYPANTA